jgi:hypothetical protein
MDTFHARKLALCAALLLGACSDGDDSFTVFTPAPAPAPTPTGPSAEPDEFGLPVVKSHLSEDEAGNADGSLIVVLRQDGDSGHAGDSGGIGHDDVPFVVNAESDFRFCVEANGDPEHRLEVLGAGDEPLLQVDGGGCGVLRLAEGNYIKRVFHGDSLTAQLRAPRRQAVAFRNNKRCARLTAVTTSICDACCRSKTHR